MKKLFIFPALIFSTYFGNVAHAQIGLSINIGTQPVWGPTGYDNAQFYYIPDADAYYDVNRRIFIYEENGQWINAESLPGRYGNIDLYSVHKVVINQPSPWLHGDLYRRRYARYRGMHDQHAIRDSHDARYFQNPGHPQHDGWMRDHGGMGHGGDHGGMNHGDNHGGMDHGGMGHDNGHQGGGDMHGGGQQHGGGNAQPGAGQHAASQTGNTLHATGAQQGGLHAVSAQHAGTTQAGGSAQHAGGTQAGGNTQHTGGGTQTGGQHSGGGTQGGGQHSGGGTQGGGQHSGGQHTGGTQGGGDKQGGK